MSVSMLVGIALPSFDQHGDEINEGKVKTRLNLIPEDHRFNVPVKLSSWTFHYSHTLLPRRYVSVEDSEGKELLLDVKVTAKRLHLSHSEVKEMTRDGKLDKLIQQARRVSKLFAEMEKNQIVLGSHDSKKFLNMIHELKKDNGGIAIRTRLKEREYLLDKNKNGFVDMYRIEEVLGGGKFGIVRSMVDVLKNRKIPIVIKEVYVQKRLQENDSNIDENEEKKNSSIKQDGLIAKEANQSHIDAENEYLLLCHLHKNGKITGIQYAPFKFLKILDPDSLKLITAYITPKYDRNFCEEIERLDELESREPEMALQAKLFQFYQHLSGLTHLHENGILHGDIKPGNILVKLNSKGMLVSDIADLGGAMMSISERRMRSVYTRAYYPESDLKAKRHVTENRDYREMEEKRDVFALGMVFYKTLTHNHRPYDLTPEGYVDVQSAYQEMTDPRIPKKLQILIKQMLDPDHSRRPSAYEGFKQLDSLLHDYPEILVQLVELANP